MNNAMIAALVALEARLSLEAYNADGELDFYYDNLAEKAAESAWERAADGYPGYESLEELWANRNDPQYNTDWIPERDRHNEPPQKSTIQQLTEKLEALDAALVDVRNLILCACAIRFGAAKFILLALADDMAEALVESQSYLRDWRTWQECPF